MSDNLWRMITTIPRDRNVMVKSITGIECLAKVSANAQIKLSKQTEQPMIHCWRKDLTGKQNKSGDINAIAWKEIEEND